MIELRRLDSFEGTGFAELSESIFGNAARRQQMDALVGDEDRARHQALCASLPAQEKIRIGAFEGDALVGFTLGRFEADGRVHVGLSAVREDHRRRGLYTRLMHAIEDAARGRGALSISSQHVANNVPVLIAKLRLGYLITGTDYVEQMGLLVRLVRYLAPGHRALFEERVATLGSRAVTAPGAGCDTPPRDLPAHR